MKIYLNILLLLLGSTSLSAQYSEIEEFALGNLGGEINNNDYRITQSIGDLVGTTVGNINQSKILVQGFPQCINCTDCAPLVSVNPALDNPLVKVFPNPTKTILTLEGEEHALHSYELYSPNGQQIKGDQLEVNQIDLSELSPGVYFLQIFDLKQELSFSGSILKQ